MKKITIIIILVLLLQLLPSVSSIPNYISNPTPSNGERDVTVTAKGVQTCVDVVIPSGCTANITFSWVNMTEYYNAWLAWRGGSGPRPTVENHTYYYYNYTNVNSSTTYCAWNANVSCSTENKWDEKFYWSVTVELNCSGIPSTFTEDYYFYPELCELFYIFPRYDATNVCPCCDTLCVGINNEQGHPMNITILGSVDGVDFYEWTSYSEVTNDTYCICIENFNLKYPQKEGVWVGASGLQAPGIKPATMVIEGCGAAFEFTDNQEENVHFNMRIPNDIYLGRNLTLDFGWSSPTVSANGNWVFSYDATSLNDDVTAGCDATLDELFTSSATANGFTMSRYQISTVQPGDRCLHCTLERDGNDPLDTLNADAYLYGLCLSWYNYKNQTEPMKYNHTYHWYVSVEDTVDNSTYQSNIFQFTTAEDPNDCLSGAELLEQLNIHVDSATDRSQSYLVGGLLVFPVIYILMKKKSSKKDKQQQANRYKQLLWRD